MEDLTIRLDPPSWADNSAAMATAGFFRGSFEPSGLRLGMTWPYRRRSVSASCEHIGYR